MKRIVFLIIASLLVLGLVLAGCGGEPSEQEEEEENTINIAITGPMTFDQGKHIWYGALLKAEQINAAGGVDIGGVMHQIELTQVDTNEIMDITGTDGTMALTAVIDDVDFVLGGFQESSTAAYREVAMNKEKIFICSGVSTVPLFNDVMEDYDHYKYFFQGAVFNDYFLDYQFSSTFSLVLAYGFAIGGDYTPRIAIVAEDEEWCDPSVAGMEAFLQSMGWWVGTWRVDAAGAAEDVLAALTEVATDDPHFIYSIFSGPAGVSVSKLVRDTVPYAMVVGCNTEAQRENFDDLTMYDPDKAPGCAYEITGDYFAPGIQLTSDTAAFLEAFVDRWGEFPIYSAGSYDALGHLLQDVETAADELDVTDIADVVSAENIDTLIQIHEQSTYDGAGAKYRVYPMPIELEEPVTHPYYGITTNLVLSEEVVNDLYPDLATYGMTYDPAYWTAPPHTAHCLVGGSDWATGISIQWQEVSPGVWEKRAIWPWPLFDPADVEGMVANGWLNQWGNYNFAYPGTSELQMPDWWIAHHFGG